MLYVSIIFHTFLSYSLLIYLQPFTILHEPHVLDTQLLEEKNTVTEPTTKVFGRGHRINKPSTNLQACVANDVRIAHLSISFSHNFFLSTTTRKQAHNNDN